MNRQIRGKEYVSITTEVSERINILKWLFMVMVVFIHSTALPKVSQEIIVPEYVAICKQVVTEGICSMAVPGFLGIAGFLLFRNHFIWKQNIRKKLYTILIPYFIINTFWIILFSIFCHIPSVAPFFDQYRINTVQDVMGAYLNGIPYYYPFWFLRDLFIMNIFAGVLQWLFERVPLVTMIGVIAIYFWIDIPVLVENDTLLFFAIGAYIARYNFKRHYFDRVPTYIFIILYGCLLLDTMYGQAISAAVRNIVGIILLYRITGYIYNSKRKKFYIWCSQFSFFIFAFHEYYEAIIKKLLFIFLPQTGLVQLLEFFLLPICMVLILLIVGYTTKRAVPQLYKVVCGQR